MQLTSIEQCKAGMTVWHPIWGKGEITLIDKFGKRNIEVTVKFAHCKHYFFSGIGEGYNQISHLYTTDIFICEKIEYSTGKWPNGRKAMQSFYQPVNKEQ